MGRKSALPEKKWELIGKRLLAGEGARALGREFGISEAAIRKRFGARTKEVKSVASKLAEAELEFSKLPISSQIDARTLADELKSISSHLASAAKYGAMTAHRLSGLANNEVQKIDDVDPLQSLEAVKGVAVLTRLANDSAEIGLNLLKANKDAIDKMNEPASDDNKLLRDIAAILPN